MEKKNDVEMFLSHLRAKLNIHGVNYEYRIKNQQGLIDLEILPNKRTEVLKSLTSENYCSGPNKDENDSSRPDYYVFGIDLNGQEVYIKLNQGKENKPVYCLSFHLAEHTLQYPLK